MPTCAKVRCQGLYPGIDLFYYGNQGQLEFDFLLAPGGDAAAISLHFDGADEIQLDEQGNLVLQIAGAKLQHHKPIIYQTIAGVRKEVTGGYQLKGNRTVGFKLDRYDVARPLVPPLLPASWSLRAWLDDG